MSDDTSMEDMRKRLVDWYDGAARIQGQYLGAQFTKQNVELFRCALQVTMSDCGLSEHFVVRVRVLDEGRSVQAMPVPVSMPAHRYVALVKARGFTTLAPPTLRIEA